MKNNELKTNREIKWEENFQLLLKYKEINSTVYIPLKLRESGNPELKKLSIWSSTQREYFHKGLLKKDKYERLKSIGFDFGKKDVELDKRIQDLINFKKKYGHYNVPLECKEFSNLGNWVSIIRNNFNNEECLKKLKAIGFDWDLVDKVWLKNYYNLLDYKEKHGSFKIINKKLNAKLYKWILDLRKAKREGLKEYLSDTKINLLDEIGFPWESKDLNWDKYIIELKKFKELNGHCLVPYNNSGSNELYSWLHYIRKNRAKLSEDKIKILESLNFEWDRKNASRIEKDKMRKLLSDNYNDNDNEMIEIL